MEKDRQRRNRDVTKSAEEFHADMQRYLDERKKREMAVKRAKRLTKTSG